jgi:hypothetical protein
MKNYNVTVEFKNDFSCDVNNVPAIGKTDAQAKALKAARSLGYNKPVKKYVVREVAS